MIFVQDSWKSPGRKQGIPQWKIVVRPLMVNTWRLSGPTPTQEYGQGAIIQACGDSTLAANETSEQCAKVHEEGISTSFPCEDLMFLSGKAEKRVPSFIEANCVRGTSGCVPRRSTHPVVPRDHAIRSGKHSRKGCDQGQPACST